MEKLKKYNQRLLAIIGSLAVLLLLGLLVAGIIGIVHELTRPKYVQHDDSITIEEPTKDSLKYRDQSVTFLKPVLIDTIGSNYLIPVSQIKLSVYEDYIDEESVLGLSSGSGKRYYKSNRRSGNYNNFILRNEKSGEQQVLFLQKCFITSYQFFKSDSSVYLIFEGIDKDSNKDKKLNSSDLKSLFFYDLQNDKMSKINFENMSLENVYFLYNSNKLNLEFGIDRNKNGEFSRYEESSIFKSFDFKTGEIVNLIDEQIQKKVQQIID